MFNVKLIVRKTVDGIGLNHSYRNNFVRCAITLKKSETISCSKLGQTVIRFAEFHVRMTTNNVIYFVYKVNNMIDSAIPCSDTSTLLTC